MTSRTMRIALVGVGVLVVAIVAINSVQRQAHRGWQNCR
jgi:hypothetical protein